jgi:hypothetical protein
VGPVFAFASLFLVVLASPALALNCGSKYLREGLSAYQVYQQCGEPNWRNSRVIYVTMPLGAFNPNSPAPALKSVPITVEEWIYDFGPTRLMQRLIFESDRLKRVENLGYGN